MAKKDDAVTLEVGGHEVRLSSPGKVVFPESGITKRDLADYYLAVADGALRGVANRPMVLKRFVKGIGQEAFFQKRVPDNRPEFVSSATLHYASGTSAEEAVIRDAAGLVWAVGLGCLDLNPHPVRADDLDHPDELRIDLDPMPGVEWSQIVDVAFVARDLLGEVGLVGWPKTSGSRGIHILVRTDGAHDYAQVRLAAQAFAREVENRAPGLATAHWWKEERGESVFVDFNQNAKDRTVASAYSVRPLPDARVSMPVGWQELREIRPGAFTVQTVPALYAERGDAHAGIDEAAGSLDRLLELAERLGPAERAPRGGDGSGRRQSTMPLVEISRAATKEEALAGLDRWKGRHGEVVRHLSPADVLVDGMRGSSSLWYRVRVNLQHVPDLERPPQEPLEVDYDPWTRSAGSDS
ncbi:non-homologous end-joining DNA ligase [Microbacterium sp. NPDC077663]|uniref:non-homologous end-joining DNA ligase n=1 Tax=Microbacterium sp. NPDC077663 TaxID=3364189 RepID=UPI0037C8FA40